MVKPNPKRYMGVNYASLSLSDFNCSQYELWTQSTECENCNLWQQQQKCENQIWMNTTFETILMVKNSTHNCTTNFHFKEEGIYVLNDSCDVETKNEGINSNLPILYYFIGLVFLFVLWIIMKKMIKHFSTSDEDTDNLITEDLGSTGHVETYNRSISEISLPSKRRLRSLDTFRGLAIVLMIFVNYGGGQYYFFQHSVWNGLTVADLVFPWFIWIMGVSMVLSLHSLLRRSVPKREIFKKIVIRTLLLFLIGLILNTRDENFQYKTMRIFGVLQRISLCYFLAATCDLIFTQTNDIHLHEMAVVDHVVWWTKIRDIWVSLYQWIFAFVLILIHELLTFYLHSENCKPGYLGPGGANDEEKHAKCTGGAAGYIDSLILTNDHMYKSPTCKTIYNTSVNYDPEGILGTLTCTFLVFTGLGAGKILVFHLENKSRYIRWMIATIITVGIGLILCLASKNDGWIPINKNLWSLSFVFVTGSSSFFLLMFFYFLIDDKKWWTGAPLSYAGMNSLLLYVGHEMVTGMFPWSWQCKTSANNFACYLGSSLWGAILWIFIAAFLYYKKIFFNL